MEPAGKKAKLEMTVTPAPIPGFVDLQINGWGGVDFSVPALTVAQAASAFDQIIASGTAYFLPTIVTSSLATYQHVLPLLSKLGATPKYKPHVLGLHLEGPFISPEPGAAGAHNTDHMRAPDAGLLRALAELASDTVKVKILTIAAELPGADVLIKAATEQGIVVSLGHQVAEREDVERAVAAGATMLTHLGNGCPNSVHRHTNPLVVGAANDGLVAGIITDGFHLPPDVLKVLLRTKGVERLYITSDAASAAGLPPGVHHGRGTSVVIEQFPHGVKISCHDRPCLAGSGAAMLQCANHLHSLDLVTADELRRLSFENPLRFIGMAPSDLLPVPAMLAVDADGVYRVEANPH